MYYFQVFFCFFKAMEGAKRLRNPAMEKLTSSLFTLQYSNSSVHGQISWPRQIILSPFVP